MKKLKFGRGLRLFGIVAVALLALALQFRRLENPIDRWLDVGVGIALIILAVLIARRPPLTRPPAGWGDSGGDDGNHHDGGDGGHGGDGH